LNINTLTLPDVPLGKERCGQKPAVRASHGVAGAVGAACACVDGGKDAAEQC
jgi:hypothetical protein